MTTPELNDVQKEDLGRIWSNLCVKLHATNLSLVQTSNNENGQAMMDDHSYQFVA